MKLFLSLPLIFLFSSCALGESPREKLNRGVFSFNEGLRWSRFNEVFPVVDPDILQQFMEMHQGWGDIIKISDIEVMQITYDEKNRKAVVGVKFNWYRKNEMLVYDTFTNQYWEYREGKWWMNAHEYVSGEAF